MPPELMTTWNAAIERMNLPPQVSFALYFLLGLSSVITYLVRSKKLVLAWGSRVGGDKYIDGLNAASRQFANDYHAAMVTRKDELESLVRSNIISLSNNVIYPYLRSRYIEKLDPQLKLERYNLMQPTMVLIKSALNEFFYQAIRVNGFCSLPEADLATYCWKKTDTLIELVEDRCCRYINRDEIITMEVFNRDSDEFKDLQQNVFQFLSRPIDPNRPASAGVLSQIVQHECRTQEKIQQLASDPFLKYTGVIRDILK